MASSYKCRPVSEKIQILGIFNPSVRTAPKRDYLDGVLWYNPQAVSIPEQDETSFGSFQRIDSVQFRRVTLRGCSSYFREWLIASS